MYEVKSEINYTIKIKQHLLKLGRCLIFYSTFLYVSYTYLNILLTALKLLPDGSGNSSAAMVVVTPTQVSKRLCPSMERPAVSSSFTLQNKKKSAGAKPGD
jgi:hypothetical protein